MNLSHNHDPSLEAPVPRRGRVSTIRIAVGLFGAPAAWLAQFSLSEPLAAHACYPYQAPLSAPIWQGLPAILAAISIACFAAALLSGFVAWTSWLQSERKPAGEGRSVIKDSVDLSSSKPSPAGEGWVRGNQHRKKSLFLSPHPSLLPEGEGAHALKSTVLSTIEAGESRNRFLVKLSLMSSFIFIVAIIFNIFAVLLVPPCSSWF